MPEFSSTEKFEVLRGPSYQPGLNSEAYEAVQLLEVEGRPALFLGERVFTLLLYIRF